MGWEQAGVAWSARAADWAYLMEPLFSPVYDALVSSLPLRPEDRLLDVGCGAGRGLQAYAGECSAVAGIDASRGLLDIAQLRAPDADLRQGSMTELPWQDHTFDAVTGVNAFVYADDGALAEAHRVLKPGGKLGMGFWTDPRDFGWAMAALAGALEPYVGEKSAYVPLALAEADSARALLEVQGFSVCESGTVEGVSEFTDVEAAYRGLASTGMIHPLVQDGAEAALRASCVAQLAERCTEGAGIRMAATFGWVVAQRTA